MVPTLVDIPITPAVHNKKETLPLPRESSSTPVAPTKSRVEKGPITADPGPAWSEPVAPPILEVSPPLPKPTPHPAAPKIDVERVQRVVPVPDQAVEGNPLPNVPKKTAPDPFTVPSVIPSAPAPALVPATPVEPRVLPTTPTPTSTPPLPIQTPTAPRPASKVAQVQKLKMLLRMGVGMPRFEIRNATGEELLLKVYAEKIEMKSAPEGVKASPLAGITASGKVKFTSSGIEGTCDELSILSGTGEVMLKGNVHMKTKLKGKSWSEMTADKMIYQIGGAGLSAASSTSRSTFTPVEYHENH